jgi:hypothetical protein
VREIRQQGPYHYAFSRHVEPVATVRPGEAGCPDPQRAGVAIPGVDGQAFCAMDGTAVRG